MICLKTIEALREFRSLISGTVGFVPTMGALHSGHLSLIERSRGETDQTIVSIYVNPTQFNNASDLNNYPCTLRDDLRKLSSSEVAAVFLPDYDMLYPDNFSYQIDEKNFSHELCGEHRPGHFTGVLTVVMKLLNLVKADKAYFGDKDFQQLSLVQGMAQAFFIDTEIIGCPIVREDDGLAMSSRNVNLSASERARSPLFHKILSSGRDDEEVIRQLRLAGFEIDYVATKLGRRFGAVLFGTKNSPVRLIDNVAIG